LSISSIFYEQLLRQYYCAQKLQSQTVTREKLGKTLSYNKAARKMMVKLKPGQILLAFGFNLVLHREGKI
jgi:hypothetical protein